jgi:glycosyltransferase involved in cell wall biosynthesis
MGKSLYICYFGLREPLVQTQVIPYLREIMKDGIEVTLLTFEPEFHKRWTAADIEAERSQMAQKGIKWHALAYHKNPSAVATAYDILIGALYVRQLIAREKFDVLHCRVHVPAMIGALARKLSRRKPKMLFDIRGLFPEEYTDAGIWPENGWLFKTAKRLDRWLMKESDGFVVLTEKARQLLFAESEATGFDWAGRPVAMIPCCADFGRFSGDGENLRAETRQRLGVGDRTVAAYVGSFGGWYLSEELFDFLRIARENDPDIFVLILTQRDKDVVISRLKESGYEDSDFLVKSVKPAEIPEYIRAADFALSFIKRCYSKLGASPTKIAEYLACGVPIIANRGVGDIDELIEGDGVGALLDGFDRACYIRALSEIDRIRGDRSHAIRCMESASRRFDLFEVGGPRYRDLYKKLLSSR